MKCDYNLTLTHSPPLAAKPRDQRTQRAKVASGEDAAGSGANSLETEKDRERAAKAAQTDRTSGRCIPAMTSLSAYTALLTVRTHARTGDGPRAFALR